MKPTHLPDTMVPEPVLAIYHHSKRQFISALKAAVFAEAQFEVIPEIIDIFGDDYAIKFLEIFSGRVISVPAIRDIVKKLKEVSIWTALESARRGKRDHEQAVAILATKFKIRKSQVRTIHEAMCSLMESLAMEVRPASGEEEDD